MGSPTGKNNQNDLNMLIEQAREIARKGQKPWPSALKRIVPNKRNTLYTEACRKVRAEIEADEQRIELAPTSLINKATELAKGVFNQQLDKIATTIASSVANDLWTQHKKQLQEAKDEIEQGYQNELAQALDAVDQANKSTELAQQLAAAAEQKAKHYQDINEKLQAADATRTAQMFKLQEQLNQQNQQIAELTTQLSAAMQQLATKQAAPAPEPEQPTQASKVKKSRIKATNKQQTAEQPTPTTEADTATPAKTKRRAKATKAPKTEPSDTPEAEQDPILTPQALEAEPTPKRTTKTRSKKTAK